MKEAVVVVAAVLISALPLLAARTRREREMCFMGSVAALVGVIVVIGLS